MANGRRRLSEVGLTALRLGLTSFGGPVAHIGYFRQTYVSRKKWLSDEQFADLTALCQFLPGPASSQLGMAIGIGRAGMLGGIVSWLGFTLPSALLLTAFAFLARHGAIADAGWLRGLNLAAVAVVAHAVWSMGRTLAPDKPRIAMVAASAAFAIAVPGAIGQLAPIALCGIAGAMLLKPRTDEKRPTNASPSAAEERVPGNRKVAGAVGCLVLFAALLAGLPALAAAWPHSAAQLADIGYRAGSLVFGGGHVVLPMLHDEIVGGGFTDERSFLAGYGATQAVPGPLFTFAAYLGAASSTGTDSIFRAILLLISIFLPSFLLVAGVLPFWGRLREFRTTRAALSGVNASVVGILLAALYDPVWIGTIHTEKELIAAGAGFLAIAVWGCPPWLLAVAAAAIGWLLYS
ncbi:chromate efflux transporter [Cohnella suwonensis]|uniref:Chromate efflux transporter n=1 Tax=Cohnella suwonensis TaxID=696072 RepID=A0ABW0LP08_9BACL